MKKLTFLLVAMAGAMATYAQDAKTIFNSDEIVWFGLDFTKARLIGVNDEKPDVIVKDYLEAWNQPMLYERDKFPIEGTFRKVTAKFDPDVIQTVNKKATKATLFDDNEAIITTAAIQEAVKEYPMGAKKQGLGLVFFIESFNKKKKLATAHVVFFDIASHKVLLTKRVTAEPGGGGLKYYWSNSVSHMFKSISDSLYDVWKKEALK